MKRILFALLACANASAVPLVVDATNFGFYHEAGSFTSTTNHAVGWYPGALPAGELRNFFVFDLSSISGVITSATLRAYNPSTGYSSPDPSETWGLFDVSSSLGDLAAGTGGIPVFQDLGTGFSYGSITAAFTNDSNVDVILNAAGLVYLNSVAGAGSAAIGGAITSINFANTTQSERLFNSATGDIARQLLLEVENSTAAVPEPGTFGGAAAGLIALLWLRRKQSS